jgi:hypothetical protein
VAFPFLAGTETIGMSNLTSNGNLKFRLPGERLRIGMDIGSGMQTPEVVLQTVMVRVEDRQVDLVWRGAFPYPGPDWMPQMRKMDLLVQ